MESAVSMETENVIWESATFDAVSVRLSAQRHGVRTDASTRYEKSLDPLLASAATARIYDYLTFLGKDISVTAVGSYLDTAQVKNITLEVSYDFINTKAGIEIPQEKVNAILTSLGFTFTIHNSQLIIIVPSWRASKDISIREDIAEEVIRIYGYNNIPLSPLTSAFSISTANHEKNLRDLTLAFWEGKNWNEVYNYSFTNESLDRGIGYTHMDDAIGIRSAFNESYTHMRRSLAVRLLENISANTKHSSTLRFFEIAKVYHKTSTSTNSVMTDFLTHVDRLPFPEKKMLAGVTLGSSIEELRSDIEAYLNMILGYIPPLHQDGGSVLACLHPGVSASYRVGDITVARFGRVHPETAEAYDIPVETLYVEFEYEELLALMADRESPFTTISRFQRIDRELNFVMTEPVRTGEIATTISALHPWIRDITVDSIFRDEAKVGADNKSVNFAFSLQSDESTISDDEAMAIQTMIIDKMAEQGIAIR